MITVTLYTKKDCSLCETAHQDLEVLAANVPHTLAVIDIDEHADLRASFTERVPVVQVGPYTLEAPFDRQKLEMTLAAARDRHQQTADDPGHQARQRRGAELTGADRFTHWVSRHYLALVNLFLLLYVGLPFLAPVLMNAGMPTLARPIYSAYGAVCHQMAFRSWFMFGDQAVYPRASAEIEGLTTYGEATGLSEEDLLAARRFVGNEELGYKVAYCERDVAMYGAMLLFGLVFALTGRRLRSLPWYVWVGIGIAPIATDGFSQLFSQLPGWGLWAYRESSPLLRTLTGGLFGFTTAWFGLPLFEESMADTRLLLSSKRARLDKNS